MQSFKRLSICPTEYWSDRSCLVFLYATWTTGPAMAEKRQYIPLDRALDEIQLDIIAKLDGTSLVAEGGQIWRRKIYVANHSSLNITFDIHLDNHCNNTFDCPPNFFNDRGLSERCPPTFYQPIPSHKRADQQSSR